MGRKAVIETCLVCGGQGRKINYTSGAKGKIYHYSKFVHSNGVVHYYRQTENTDNLNSTVPIFKKSLFEALEEIVDVKMREKELRFRDIKSLLEDTYGKPIVTATVYRNINKLLKLDLITKRISHGVVLYGRPSSLISKEIMTSKMSIGFDFAHDDTFITMFFRIKNSGIGLVAGYTISLPVGYLDSIDQIDLIVFDEIGKIELTKTNIAYSWSDRTGISIPLNRPLRKSEEEYIFLSCHYKFLDGPINIMIPSDVDFLKVNCEVEKGGDVEIKKRLSDGFKEIEPVIVKRTGNNPGHVIFETEFENALKGETIVISKRS